jgi:hypothetical protein
LSSNSSSPSTTKSSSASNLFSNVGVLEHPTKSLFLCF